MASSTQELKIPETIELLSELLSEKNTIKMNQKPQHEKLLRTIEKLKEALEKTKDLGEKPSELLMQSIQRSLMEVIKNIQENQNIREDLVDAIREDIINLYHELGLFETSAHFIKRGSTGSPKQSGFKLPNFYAHTVFDESPTFKEIEKVYEGFHNTTYKKCFLYFAVFPENVELKKRFLTHWWIGEGLLDPSGTGDKTPENVAGDILRKFSDKGLIVVKEERKMIIKRFRVPPLVRSAAITLAKEKRDLEYDSGDNPTGKSSGCDRIFLVKGDGYRKSKVPTKMDNLEQTMASIFNVSQRFPDSALEWLAKKGEADMTRVKVVEWFLKLRKLKVLYLGRWQSAVDEQPIEVESVEFLKGLKRMKALRLLSLQGIFSISELPNSIKCLKDLRVLDLKSCHSLEKLPEGMGSLTMLTHLDVSGCYMLDRMRKSISALIDLRVLKGFVTGRRDDLNDLKGLRKLRKLSINTSREDFPNEIDLRVLRILGEHGALRNLAIAWGAGARAGGSKLTFELPKELEKLVIECLLEEQLPGWIKPGNLKKLERLYIRGGKLKDLGIGEWSAEVVRLKYLKELKIEWRNLQECFPKLNYLQRVKCPRVTFCPCDANGVWMKQPPQKT